MITPILEKLLLHGKAKNKIAHFGWSSFCEIEIPDKSFIVVHKIYWHPAINQKMKTITDMTWKQLFRYSEMQLKVESDKETPNFYFLRNEVDIQFLHIDPAAFSLNAPIDPTYFDNYVLMRAKKPLQMDTWIASYDSLKLTLTRSALLNEVISTMGLVNNKANEKNTPAGVGDAPVLLNIKFSGNTAITNYQPPNFKNTNVPIVATDFSQRDYGMGYDIPTATDNGSFMNDPADGLNVRLANSEFVNNPLLSIEYCIVSQDWGSHLSGM